VTLLVIVAAAVAAVLGLSVLGPVLRAIFGSDVHLASSALALLGVGTSLALGSLCLLLVLLAYGRPRRATAGWLVAVAVAAVWALAWQGGSLDRVVSTFVVAEAVAFVALLAMAGPPKGAPTPEPS
jgi:hypothetical protein